MVALAKETKWNGFSMGVTEKEYAKLQNTINKQLIYNGWFTPENVRNSLLAIGESLNEVELS